VTPATASGTARARRSASDLPGPPLSRELPALALQGAEIILIGYNTPISALALDLNDLCMRAGAYANACFVVGVAKAASRTAWS